MSRRGVYAVTAAGAVVMAALVVAASGRPVAILTRPRSQETFSALPTFTLPPTSAPTTTTTTGATGGPAEISPIIILLLQVVLVLIFVVVVLVIAQLLLALVRKPKISHHDEPGFAVPPVPEELLASAQERIRLLETGDPRNAIVAAWLNLETSAGATGLPRHPAETSTEYTERVLATWDIDPVRIDDLAGLYREARFSLHPLGEDHRRRAIADLHVLHADLDRVAAGQSAGQSAGPTGQVRDPLRDQGQPR
ncbi:hypothetical protein GCM10027053_42210 [Intrasporangium mesophilum]